MSEYAIIQAVNGKNTYIGTYNTVDEAIAGRKSFLARFNEFNKEVAG